MSAPVGWQCPGCGTGYAPSVLECRHCGAARGPAGYGSAEEKCSGCGVSVGQSHWDNCPLHPPFSQPIFRGSHPLVRYGSPEDVCTGCGVRPGDTHWDNCEHHPPFSQPRYYGGGR